MYSTEFLVRHGLLDTKGRAVGLAGLASHLFYHEPFNFAFCHLLEDGAFHHLCCLNKFGKVSADSLNRLMIVLSFLFTSYALDESLMGSEDLRNVNSVVKLPPLPKKALDSLLEFNSSLKVTFQTYLKAVSCLLVNEDEVLPVSKIKFRRGPMLLREDGAALSTFALLSGIREQDLDLNDEANSAASNLKDGLLAQNLPKMNVNAMLNSFALDFYKNGEMMTSEPETIKNFAIL